MAMNFRNDYKFVPEYSYGQRDDGGLLGLLQAAIQQHQAQQRGDFSPAKRYDDSPSNWFTQLASLHGDQTPYQPRDVGQTRPALVGGSPLSDDLAGSPPSGKGAPTRIAQIAIPLPPPIPIPASQPVPLKIPMPTIPDHWQVLGAIAQMLPRLVLGDSAGNGDEPTDPNFRQLTRRPSLQPAVGGDQPVTTYSSGTGASPASSDLAAGAPEDNPTANLTGDSLAAKAPDPTAPKVIKILGAPSVVPGDNPTPDPDEDDDDCMRQRNKEISACYKRLKRNPKWDYVNECVSRAKVRWDLCNRTGQIPDDPPAWGRRQEGR